MGRLHQLFDLSYNHRNRSLTQTEIIRGIQGREALIAMLSDKIDGKILRSNPGLKIVANYAVGYNNIDLSAASSNGTIVTNTPGVLTDATADLTWSLILSLSRHIVQGDGLVRSKKWAGWSPTQLLGSDLSGKTLGIIGCGRIGRAVAQRAGGFKMRTVYNNRRRLSPRLEKTLRISYCSFSKLLMTSDIVSLHLPLTSLTLHLMNARTIRRMKSTALLINTSRGAVINEKDLTAALKKREIAGAGLDVFEREPKIQGGLQRLPNTILLPHLGSATTETRVRMGLMVIENIQAVLKGRSAPYEVKAHG